MATFDFPGTVQFDDGGTGGTRTILLTADLLDSADIQENRAEFRDLTGDVVNFIFNNLRNAAEDLSVNLIEFDLDLDDYARWEADIDRIFLNLKAGFQPTHTLTRDVVGASVTSRGVREFRFSRIP